MLSPRLLTRTKSGTKVVTAGMISIVRTRPKRSRFPANSSFAKAYPAIELKSRLPATHVTATSVLLKKYSAKFCFDSNCSKFPSVGERGSQTLGFATISPVGLTDPRNIHANGASVASSPNERAPYSRMRAGRTGRDALRADAAAAEFAIVVVMSRLRSEDAELQEAEQRDRGHQHVRRGGGRAVVAEAELLVGVVTDRGCAAQRATARHHERLLEELQVTDAQQYGDHQCRRPEQRQRDTAEGLPTGGAVDASRLEQVGWNGL